MKNVFAIRSLIAAFLLFWAWNEHSTALGALRECRSDPFIGKPRDKGFTMGVPPSKSALKVAYECKSVSGDSEAARLTLYEGGKGELAYIASDYDHSVVCPLHWKTENKLFSIDLKTQKYLKLFFSQGATNAKLLNRGRFQFSADSKISITTTPCERVNP